MADCEIKERGDPDVTGFGVLVAFTVPILITAVTMIYGYVTMAIPPDKTDSRSSSRYNGFDRMIIRAHRQKEPDELRALRAEAFQAFMLAMSDQQLVTGTSLVIAIFIIRRGAEDLDEEISVYSYSNAVMLAYFSCIIHLASISTLRSYFNQHKVLRFIRVAIMLLDIGLLLEGLVESVVLNMDTTLRCAVLDLHEDTYGAYFGQPAIFLNYFLLLLIIIGGYIRRLSELYSEKIREASGAWQAIAKAIVSRWRPLRLRQDSEESKALTKFQLCRQLEATKGLWNNVGLSARLFFLIIPAEIAQSFLYEILWLLFYITLGAASIGYSLAPLSGLKADISTVPKFGQILPVVLLFLPFLTIAENFAEFLQKKNAIAQNQKKQKASPNEERLLTKSKHHPATDQRTVQQVTKEIDFSREYPAAEIEQISLQSNVFEVARRYHRTAVTAFSIVAALFYFFLLQFTAIIISGFLWKFVSEDTILTLFLVAYTLILPLMFYPILNSLFGLLHSKAKSSRQTLPA